MPVGIGIEYVGSDELRRRISKGCVIGSDRDDEFRVFEPRLHDIADGELLLNARLSNETRERDHLLNCAVAQHTINFIPEVIAAAKTALVNPYPISSRCKL